MPSFSPGFGRKNDVRDGAPPPVPAPGVLLFGRYRLEERLGLGGMAEVWRAHDEQLDRFVAIKLLHRHLLPDERSRERFAAEARAVAGLSHPGIVTVHDIVVDDDHAAIVLELVDGEPLSDLIRLRGRLPELAAASIAAQVAHALQAAHDRGLVHRDVKPANVLVSPDGRARLVDFGIARALDDREVGLTLPGTIMGTLRYMAPEQLADGAADRATDVFGLGSLLYEMLVARPPFPAATPAALMAQQRQGAPPIFTASPELASLARTALQHDPERRPRTAGRMAALVERWLENRGASSADLPAVATAALFGGPMPRPAPVVLPVPAITPAPIVDAAPAAPPPATAMPTAPPKVTKHRARKVDPSGAPVLFPPPAVPPPPAIVPPPAAIVPVPPNATPVGGTPDPAAVAAVVVAASRSGPTQAAVPPPRPPVAPPQSPPAGVETAAITAPGTTIPAPFGLAGRRVPLIAALGLAGLLLAGLLLAGALTALQAGSARPGSSPVPSRPADTLPAAATTPPPTATTPPPTATVTAKPAQILVIPTSPGKGRPKDHKQHDGQGD